MSTRYKGSLMSSTAAVTNTATAPGIWRSNEVMQAIKAVAWPPNAVASEYLVIAGGNGGGYFGGGGGGAGGLLTSTIAFLPSTAYTVTIGAGAPAAPGTAGGFNQTGYSTSNPSILSSLTAAGGGCGGGYNYLSGVGQSGASGGGGGSATTGGAGGTASPSGQGNIGGSGNTDNATYRNGGGGGGSNGSGNNAATNAGNGGAGYTSSISGTSTVYAGGGGGGAADNANVKTGGAGGTGGGGRGCSGGTTVTARQTALAGTANTGGGGGGSGRADLSATQLAAAGGSGIVIIAYPSTYASISAFSSGLTVNGTVTTGSNVPAPDTASRSGYKVYKFTAGTGTFTI